MSNFFKKRILLVVSIIAVFILGIMAALEVTDNSYNAVKDLTGTVLSPVLKFFSTITTSVKNFAADISELATLRKDNEQLKEKIKELEVDQTLLETYKNENERLKALLELKDYSSDWEMVGAKIIAMDGNSWFTTFTIDKGTSDGISKNCAVVTNMGLVGYVYDVGTTWAQVRTVIDSEFSMGVIVSRTNDRGILEGDLSLGSEGLCKMTYISKDAKIVVGDYVRTSGLSGNFPPDIIVGKIKEIKTELHGLSNYAIVEPSVDFLRLSEVLVIKKY